MNYSELQTYKKVGRFLTFIGEIIGEIIANLLSYVQYSQAEALLCFGGK